MAIKDDVNRLFETQLNYWEFARKQYDSLQRVETKTFQLSDNVAVDVQFNPERMKSSSAKVDKTSIAERPCFLCSQNRPKEQDGVDFQNFVILINPYPIFKRHLTIVHNEHRVQEIMPFFASMLDISVELPDYTIFYNGAKCGASAPDHFHFQAGIKGFLPIEQDFESQKHTELISETNNCKIFRWNDYHRSIITITGDKREIVTDIFKNIYQKLQKFYDINTEPMLNILAYYRCNEYVVHILPRILHRPACYFHEGDAQILLSPASVDLGGVLITPRQEDFQKITSEDILSIFNQVCVPQEELFAIIN